MTPSVATGGTSAGTITATVGAPKQRAYSLGLTSPAYVAGGHSQELSGFNPRLRSPDNEVMQSRDRIVARSRDIDRNNALINGGIDRRVDAVVGSNIWLKLKPDFAAMGLSAEWADEWATKVEALFRVWGKSSRFVCDVERHHHFGGLVQLAYRHYVVDGSACAAMYMLDRGSPFQTSVLVVDPDRLSNKDGAPDSATLRGGVELDQWGAEVAYHVRNSHPDDAPGDYKSLAWTRIPRETATGRPLFVRAIAKRRAHQHHSIGRLASAISRITQQGLADKTELQAQITNAIFGLYARTKRSSDDMAASMSPVDDGIDESTDAHRADFYEQADLTFNGVRVAVVPDGDSIETLTSERASSNYVTFQNYILRAIASALGLSYEQLSNDWSGINYSSARTLLNEIWRGLLADRHLFTQMFCTPIFAAWLEEAVARDLVEIPGGKTMFYVWRDALTQCEWIGPGRGIIDRKKEADGSAVDREGGVSNLEIDCAEQGRDWRDVLWQQKRELEERRKYGLPISSNPSTVGTGNAGGGNDTNAGGGMDDQDAIDARQSAGADA
ncbi:phage portal protein [Sphingomonas sp. NFR15]|uniref:phage portal protein n=1 Tax=Sphingomonas sp. NFR15 TaxID=1566282 RepID=UPI00088BF5DF|nr:phage portal protein [Sphingomonas sp. NFR15]SDA15005.1 phage portal protein, lambda family [Sphingomonas sp. NFR15]